MVKKSHGPLNLLVPITALLIALAGCGGVNTEDESVSGKAISQAILEVASPPNYTPSSGDMCGELKVTRNARGATPQTTAFPVVPNGVKQFEQQVPAGNLTFTVSIFDGSMAGAGCAGKLVFEGKAQAHVPPGGTVAVAIELHALPGVAQVTAAYPDDLGCPADAWNAENEVCNPERDLVLSGDANPETDISVDDDLTVFVDDVLVFTDPNPQLDDSSFGNGALPALQIKARNGSRLRIVGTDHAPPCQDLSPELTLHWLAPDGTTRSQLIGGFERQCNAAGGVFFDETVIVSF